MALSTQLAALEKALVSKNGSSSSVQNHLQVKARTSIVSKHGVQLRTKETNVRSTVLLSGGSLNIRLRAHMMVYMLGTALRTMMNGRLERRNARNKTVPLLLLKRQEYKNLLCRTSLNRL